MSRLFCWYLSLNYIYTYSSAVLLDPVHSQWTFCPSVAAAYALATVFAILTTIHLIQAIHYRKLYCGVIVAAALLQTLTYIFRVVSIYYPTILTLYAIWFVSILVSSTLGTHGRELTT